MRKSDGHLHLFGRTALPPRQFERGFGKVINVQGSDPPRHGGAVRAGVQAAAGSLGMAIPRGTRTTCCTRWCAWCAAAKRSRCQAAAATDAADLIDWVGRDATRFFLASAQGRHRVRLRRRPGLSQTRTTRVLRAVRARAICSCWRRRPPPASPSTSRGAAARPVAAGRRARTPLLPGWRYTRRRGAMRAGELAPHQIAFYLRISRRIFHASSYNAEACWSRQARCRDCQAGVAAGQPPGAAQWAAVLGVSAPRAHVDGRRGGRCPLLERN